MKKALIILKRNIPETCKRFYRCFKLIFSYEKESIEIKQNQLNKCKVFQNRTELIKSITNQNTFGAEVGVLYGDFSEVILNTTKIKQLTLIDIDTSMIKKQVVSNNKIKINETLSKNFTSKKLFDWIYIDGDHSYQGVKEDINLFKKLLKPKGYLVFNDYCKVNIRSLGTFGVHKAVNEFLNSSEWKVYGLALQTNCLYDIAIQKPS